MVAMLFPLCSVSKQSEISWKISSAEKLREQRKIMREKKAEKRWIPLQLSLKASRQWLNKMCWHQRIKLMPHEWEPPQQRKNKFENFLWLIGGYFSKGGNLNFLSAHSAEGWWVINHTYNSARLFVSCYAQQGKVKKKQHVGTLCAQTIERVL